MEINRIDPPYWFTGMQNCTFQLCVYGDGLRDVEIRTNIPHVGNIRIVGETSDEYSIIYITLLNGVLPDKYKLYFTKGEDKVCVEYELKEKKEWCIPRQATVTTKDVIYLVVTDRFAKGDNVQDDDLKFDRNNPDAWHGGNINGIRQHLDYLQELGVTALWLTPVFRNNDEIISVGTNQYTSYHGYAITDFYDVDAHFGTIKDYCRMVQDAHRYGLKIVKDVVFNHCSDKHVWVNRPPMKDWLNEIKEENARKTNYKVTTIFDPYASVVDKTDTIDGWFTNTMVDINLRNEHVLQYLTQMTIWWIEMAGIDAIRMDTYLYSDLQAMMVWQKRINLEYPGFSIIAETWVPESSYTAKIQKEVSCVVDSKSPFIVMDFAFQKKMEACYSNKELYDRDSQIYYHFVNDFLYASPQNTLAFLDNHDLPRWLSVNKSVAKLKQALGVLLTIPRIPQLFYGTELLFSGDGKGTGDGNKRQDFFEKLCVDNWNLKEKDCYTFVRTILAWRKTSKAATMGSMTHFIPQNGVYVYCRQYDTEKILVVVNNSNKHKSLSLSHYAEEIIGYSEGIDVVTGEKFFMKDTLNIKRNEILILNLM